MKHISKPFIGFFAAIAGGLIVVASSHFNLWGKDTPSAPQIKIESAPLDRELHGVTSFAPIVKKAAPSVVNISSSRMVRERPMRNPFQDDPIFRQFFGDPSPDSDRERMRREQSLGSGVIVSTDGYILTANHVVKDADEIHVSIADTKKEYTAKVIGADPQIDVAVLKINATGLPAITLADSDQLEVGDIVLAIGNPFDVGQSVTMGIVSGLGRNGLGFNRYENFIQTDAAINPGNSGGALVDAEGRLIGINSGIESSSRGNEGVGFAVPINMARRSMERLISGGKITRGYLGVFPQDITPGLAEQFNLSDQNGALVGDVLPDAPAEKAGIKPGDVITEFDGKQINDANSLRLLASETSPGTKVTVKLLRNGREKDVTVTLGELPAQAMQNENGQNGDNPDNSKMDGLEGVTVSDLNQDARQALQAPDNLHGAVVVDLDENSNSAEAGLQKGDVIVEINRQPVTSADDAVKLCRQAKGDKILLKVWHRDGDSSSTHYLSVDNTKKN